LFLLAVVALVACLWIGWSDFTPQVPQELVKEAIRAAPQRVMQIVVQFIAPAMLNGFLSSAVAARIRAPQRD
jgi:hypothetical protein